MAKFNLIFDDNEGKVNTFSKIVFENSFLDDFKQDFKAQAAAANSTSTSGTAEKNPVIIYHAYQPSNIVELKEYTYLMMSRAIQKQIKNGQGPSPFGTGAYSNLSNKLMNYLLNVAERKKRFKDQYKNMLWFDSLFESGNLLQA
jgi:hypothetical protein|tara:strand:- start:771 stop:1202 length:432 start_codon:yes stop_codon:yes gene_type:complete